MANSRSTIPRYSTEIVRRDDSFDVVFLYRPLTQTEKQFLRIVDNDWGAFLYDDNIPAVGMINTTPAIYAGKQVLTCASQVHPLYRRQGIASKLYDLASRIAKKEYGVHIASDTRRSPAAEELWRTLVRQGKAKRVKLRPSEIEHGEDTVYVHG